MSLFNLILIFLLISQQKSLFLTLRRKLFFEFAHSACLLGCHGHKVVHPNSHNETKAYDKGGRLYKQNGQFEARREIVDDGIDVTENSVIRVAAKRPKLVVKEYAVISPFWNAFGCTDP